MEISKNKACSLIESLLFMSSEPRPFSDFEKLFEEEMSSIELKNLLQELQQSYLKKASGIQLEQVQGGWQLRTKPENKEALLKLKPKNLFRLSRPSLEVLSVIAFEQPCTKMTVDEFRGVESGHLLRTLIEKELIRPSGKSDLPGKASMYKTSQKFLEVFGLNSLDELPSREELKELLEENNKPQNQSLHSMSQKLTQSNITIPYQKDEQENKKIKETLKSLPSTVEFLEKEQTKDQKNEEPSSVVETKLDRT